MVGVEVVHYPRLPYCPRAQGHALPAEVVVVGAHVALAHALALLVPLADVHRARAVRGHLPHPIAVGIIVEAGHRHCNRISYDHQPVLAIIALQPGQPIGEDLKSIQQMLGHESIATTEVYVGLAKKVQRRMVQDLALVTGRRNLAI